MQYLSSPNVRQPFSDFGIQISPFGATVAIVPSFYLSNSTGIVNKTSNCLHDVSFVVFIQVNLPSKSHEVACCVVSSKYFACFWSASKAVDCKGLPRGRKIFHSRLVLQQRFLSLSSTVCTFCCFRSLTFLGDDRREKAPEGTPLGWSCSSVSCHYLCTFCCLGSLTSLGGDKWKGGGAEEGKHG